jgi:hypothetical protein
MADPQTKEIAAGVELPEAGSWSHQVDIVVPVAVVALLQTVPPAAADMLKHCLQCRG